MTDMPTPADLPQENLIYSIDSNGVKRVYARIDVSGLSYRQIGELREMAQQMPRDGTGVRF